MISATPSLSWTKSAFLRANVVARANAVNDCWPTRATTPKHCAATAINIESLNETQAQAWLTQVVRSAQIPTAQHHRAYVWVAEREPSDRDTLRQAREKLCRHSLIGVFHAVSATSLFVQSLVLGLALSLSKYPLNISIISSFE